MIEIPALSAVRVIIFPKFLPEKKTFHRLGRNSPIFDSSEIFTKKDACKMPVLVACTHVNFFLGP